MKTNIQFPTFPLTTAKVLANFRQYLISLGLSGVSRKLYLADIAKLLSHPIFSSCQLETYVNPQSYFAYLQLSENNSPLTRRTLASIHHFGTYLHATYQIPNPTLSLSLSFNQSNPAKLSFNAHTLPFDKYIKIFTNHLISIHLSSQSIKSYKSDISQYLIYAHKTNPSTKLSELLSEENIRKYHDILIQSHNQSPATIVRKLKTIRRFVQWMAQEIPVIRMSDNSKVSASGSNSYNLSTPVLPPNPNPARKQQSLPLSLPWLPDHSKSFVKNNNYRNHWLPRFKKPSLRSLLTASILFVIFSTLSILTYRQFASGARLTAAFPSTPVTPNRQLSFQGRLENASGTPVTSATNFVFKLFDASSGGTELYSSGTCSITPDTDGVFSTQIGSTCGAGITSSVFSENANVWLAVTVGAETLSPRQQIATVAYALNAETVQGFPITATVSALRNTVVPMNQWGEIIIAEQSPRLKGVSGTFQISAPTLTLSTASGTNGNINLSPDGTGIINLNSNATLTGDLTITGDDLFMNTNTAGMLLIADGTNFNPTAVSGDITINGSGVTAIGGDKITESMLKAVNSPTDELCLSYESTVGDFEWQACGSGGGESLWRLNAGTISPVNDTLDLLVGSNASSSAKFAVLNVNSGTPTASISGSVANAASYLTGDGLLATTNERTLTLGDSSTGNIVLAPGGTTALTGIGTNLTAAGNVTIAGTTGLTFSGTGGDITFTNAEKIDNDTDGTLRLTAPTINFNSTTTLTATSLATLDMAATVGWDVATLNATSLATLDTADTLNLATTTLTLNSNSTINGGSAANNNLTLQGTSNATRTSSYVLLQPSGGNVGIGDTTPASLFTVGNGDLFQVDSNGDIVKIKNLTYSWPSSHTTNGILINNGSGTLSWSTIGATNITADSLDFTELKDAMTLDVSTDISTTGTSVLSITNSGTGNSLVVNDATGDTTPFVIDASGNVGIGTTSPGNNKLQVVGNSASIGVDTGLYVTNSANTAIFTHSNTDYRSSIGFESGSGQPFISLHAEHSSTLNTLRNDGTGWKGFAMQYEQDPGSGGAVNFIWNGVSTANANFTSIVNTLRMQANGLVGIGTTGPDAELDILSTTEQLRLTYTDGSVYTSFTTDSAGDLTIAPSGSDLNLTGNLSLSDSYLNFGATSGVSGYGIRNNAGTMEFKNNAGSWTALGSGGASWWDQTSGTIQPYNKTVDLLLGGTATTSAKFAVLNVNSGTPTATLSAGTNGGLYMTATGTIATTAKQTLSLGDATTTGNIILQGGNVGIGVTNPTQKLEVNGYVVGQRFEDSASSSYYLDPAATSTSLSIDGDIVSNGAFTISSNGNNNITINAGSGTVLIGTTGAGKLDAGTIDPPYTINGEKFATYMSGMTGVKEETTGTVNATELVAGKGYRATLDFASALKGSDLWLFSQTTKLQDQLDQLVVLTTAAGTSKTWYEMDASSGKLYLYAQAPTRISYRLTAPRFDASTWTNTRDSESLGFVVNNPESWSVSENIANLYNQISDTVSHTLTNLLSTDTISPLSENGNIDITAPVRIEPSSPNPDLPTLIVDGEIEATTISARLAQLEAINAETITARTIVADTISANHIEGLDAKIASLSAGLSDADLSSVTERIKARLSNLTNPVTAAEIPVPEDASSNNLADNLTNLNLATTSATITTADIDFATINTYLAVVGSATITDLSVTNNLYTNTINSQSGTLALQSLGGLINMGNNTLIVDSTGSVVVNGDLYVSGQLLAQSASFNNLELGNAPESTSSSALGNLLAVYNENGETVATIDASGSANLASLTTNMITIASSGTATDSSALATLTGNTQSNATAGNATLTTPNTELTIESIYVTPNSLVYLTPTTNTDNKVLFVKAKNTCETSSSTCIPSFTVGIDAPASTDISFNWWIIELKNPLN